MKNCILEPAVARAWLVSLVLLQLACWSLSAAVLGDRPTFGVIPEEVETDAPLIGAKTLASGERWTLGPLPLTNRWNDRYYYQWTTDIGELAGLTPENNHVVYTAPTTGVAVADQLVLWRTTEDGSTRQIIVDVTVSPGALPAQETDQLTATYNAGSANFGLSYTLGAAVAKAWILASLNGIDYAIVSTTDPVTAANRSGNVTVSIPGSGSVNQVHFRLRTQSGTGAPVDGSPIMVAYTPLTSTPKSTEIPAAPALYINGWQTGSPQVAMFWGRVNDSLNRDNVNYYEVQYAPNPDFTGAMLVNAGNTAPGLNLYESIFYTVNGLLDNNTYYFRVRGVNNAGTGQWSNVDSMIINIQDRPVFSAGNPVFPASGAVGVTKMPPLEVNVSDPDGDSFYCAFEVGETPEGPWRYFGHGGQAAYLNATRLDPAEWNPTLKPNTHYYWRAIVHEEGRDLNYYGGTWPTSPVYEFTTENVGGGYSLGNVTWISGDLRPYERVVYRVTVTNNGNATAAANLVTVFDVKNGVENPFAFAGSGQVPALSPGESAAVDVTVYYRDGLFTSSNGITYDNILLTGDNLLRFKTSPDVSTVGVAAIDHTVTYINAGGPSVSMLVRGSTPGGGFSTKPAAPRGGKFQISGSIVDDIRTTRVLLEYRMNPNSAWQVLDDYTGNTTPYINFPTCTHSGPTVPAAQNGVEWTFPGSFPLTSTVQVKLTAYDDVGATTTVTSEPMTIYDGTLTLQASATQFPAYRLGEQVSVPVAVTKAPGVLISNLQVFYYASPTGPYSTLFNQTVATSGENIDVPPVLTVTLPTADAYASDTAFLRVKVRGQVPGLADLEATDDTDDTFRTSLRDLPSPFHTAVNIFSQSYQGFPAGAWGTGEWDEAIALDWEGDTQVHALIQQQFSYLMTDANNATTSTTGNAFHHSVYDRTTGTVTTVALPAGYSADDLKVIGGVPYVLLRNGADLYWSWKSGSGFVTPQFLVTLVGIFTTSPEFVVRNGELHVAYTTRNNVVGGGTPATWRNRLMRLLPALGSYVEQNSYLGGHLDYGAGYLNGDSGLYAINAENIITSTLASWSGNPVWFSSSNSNVVGAFQNYESDHHIIDFYSPSAVATRWIIDVQEPRVRVFPDVTLGVGQATNSSPAGEDGFKVIIRRNNTTGAEERIKLGSWGQGFASTARRSAINDNKWVAVNWNRLLAVGYMGGDIIAPTVQIGATDSSFTTGQAKVINWTMSDNLGQIESVKVLKVAGGITTPLANYSGGTVPTSGTFTFADTVASMMVRIEVYDSAGNRGVAEQVLTRTGSFSIASFSASAAAVEVGTPVTLQWTATPADAFRVYSILTRPQGTADWTVAGTVTGTSFLLDTSLMSGSQEVRIESGGVALDLPQPIVITGERFAFDNSGSTPASGTIYVAAAAPLLRLNWASNQPVSPAVAYTVLGRWNGAGSYAVLGGTMEKSLEVNVGANTSLEWKVAAAWDGQEFVSSVRSVSIAAVSSGPVVAAAIGGQTTVSPWVDLSWPVQPGAEAVVIYRRNTQTDQVEELARLTGTSYRDEGVAYGDTVSYTLATVLGESVSPPGAGASVTLTPLLPLGIAFVNADYQIMAGNSNTVQWNPLLPAGTAAVFEEYQVFLRRGDGSIVRSETVTHAPGTAAQVAFTGLEYNQSYVVEVFALHPNGAHLNAEPVRLHFSTGFDNRPIAAGPAVATPVADAFGVNLSWSPVAGADYYDIFARINGGALTWLGRSETTAYADTNVPQYASVAYVVRGRNDFTYADSSQSAVIALGTPPDFGITSLRRTGADNAQIELKFKSQWGIPYRVEFSPDLAPDSWTDTGVSVTGNGGEQTITAPNAVGTQRGFFRVVKQ